MGSKLSGAKHQTFFFGCQDALRGYGGEKEGWNLGISEIA